MPLGMPSDRPYLASHPWINFEVDLARCSSGFWIHLGEAESKCQHIGGVPLMPPHQKQLYDLYLSKGVAATTNIEGSTLSEEDVRAILAQTLRLPASQQYQEREAQNIIDACNLILRDVVEGNPLEITSARIKKFNLMVLDGLELEEGVVPGEYRTHSVAAGPYLGAPASDCEYLVDQLCAWLGRRHTPEGAHMDFVEAVVKAVIAHLYIAWIHPFGDGNGRTARLIEFQILVSSGLVPVPAGHVLSNHYNRTRPRYYTQLDRARSAGGVPLFLEYAVLGFVEQLREQVMLIRGYQWDIIWENYVHSRFRGVETEANRRRKHLVLDMPPNQAFTKATITSVSPRVAQAYASKGERTSQRDLNALEKMGLIRREGRGAYRANREQILAFLPPTAIAK